MGAGFGLAVLTVDPRAAAIEDLASMRGLIDYQKPVLDDLETRSRRDVDALTLEEREAPAWADLRGRIEAEEAGA